MTIRLLTAAATLSFSAGAALALEPIELTNTYPLNEQVYMLSDRGFFTQDNVGYFEVIEGPFTGGPARCIGSGFVLADSTNTISGICIFGDGADTFTMRWEAGDRGAANDWTIAAGTGKYEGMSGEGTAITGSDEKFRSLPVRTTHIVGFVDFPVD